MELFSAPTCAWLPWLSITDEFQLHLGGPPCSVIRVVTRGRRWFLSAALWARCAAVPPCDVRVRPAGGALRRSGSAVNTADVIIPAHVSWGTHTPHSCWHAFINITVPYLQLHLFIF